MSQARGSSVVAIVFVLCGAMIFSCGFATEYIVGDEPYHWNFNVSNWPQGKTFHSGDVLVFKYLNTIHDVVQVSEDGYNNCESKSGDPYYGSGNDRITIQKGKFFFICSVPNHCTYNMKIAINADD